MNQITNDEILKRKLRIEERKKQCDELLSKYQYSPPIQPLKPFRLTMKDSAILPKIIPQKSKKKEYRIPFTKSKEKKVIIKPKKSNPIVNLNSITFSKYLQMQTLAEMNIKPGRNMTEKLLEHIDKIGVIRKKVMEKEIEPLLSLKGRYNDEIPEEDTKIELEDKALIEHKWKNSFCLSEYQNFFLDELKGKISSLNYRAMLKRFRQISRICFSKGPVNLGNINHVLSQEY